jgi:hypothetical protein
MQRQLNAVERAVKMARWECKYKESGHKCLQRAAASNRRRFALPMLTRRQCKAALCPG